MKDELNMEKNHIENQQIKPNYKIILKCWSGVLFFVVILSCQATVLTEKLLKMKNQTIASAIDGRPTPIMINYPDVQPMYRRMTDKDGIVKLLPVVNGHGRHITNDNWIYISDRNGDYSINVPRSIFCEKRQLKNILILNSIGNKKITERLAEFIEMVSDKLVFEKNGIAYRVFLKKVGRKFDLDYVKPQIFTTSIGCNINVLKVAKKYLNVCTLPGGKTLGDMDFTWSHELVVDLKSVFNFKK